MKKSWYAIEASASADVTEISVHDDIGMWGIGAARFLADLKAVRSGAVHLTINSRGGSVFDALAMFNGLRASGKTINVTVLGLAASAASFLMLAGDKISIPENAMVMVHKPLLGLQGNADDLREAADVLDKVESSIAAIYMSRWKGTPEELSAALAEESYFTAAECLAHGLCDEVTPSIEVKASFDVEDLPEPVRAVFTAAAAPAPEVAPSLVQEVVAQATAAGLADFAAAFAADATLVDGPSIAAALAAAKELQALCSVAGLVDEAPALIRARMPLAKARAHITNKLAEADAHSQIHTARPENQTANPPKFDPAAVMRAIVEKQKQERSK